MHIGGVPGTPKSLTEIYLGALTPSVPQAMRGVPRQGETHVNKWRTGGPELVREVYAPMVQQHQ